MAAPDGFRLADELRSTFLSYLTSALPIGNHQSQRELGKHFFQQWSSELFAGPLVEALPVYQKVGSLDDYFGDVRDKQSDDYKFAARMNVSLDWANVDHRFPQYRKIRDAIWPPTSDDAEEERVKTSAKRFWERPLYAHQWQSFENVSRQSRNLIVATSTGSGKTECYLIPLLHHLLTESTEKRRVAGIRALLLYPMNALVEDQMHRLRQLLFWINLQNHASGNARRPITFGRYTGATPVASNDRNPERHVSPEALHDLGELIYRSEMQVQPPDILVSNFTMLEYILLRDDDQQLFVHPECFRFLMLDEVHTYTGTQGMEVALLLRRLRAFLERKTSQRISFQVIGTSATLPSGKDAKCQTADFATTLFGVPFEQEDVIRPPHVLPADPDSFTKEYAATLLAALTDFPSRFPGLATNIGATEASDLGQVSDEEWASLATVLAPATQVMCESEEEPQQYIWLQLARILRQSPVVEKLRFVFGRHETACLDLPEVAKNLFGDDIRSSQATAVLLKLVGAAHINGEPVLPIRFHMFVKEPSSAQLCLLPSCATEEGWWSRVVLTHHTLCDECGSFMYPVLLCRRCGFTYLQGWRRRFSSGQLGADVFPEPDDADDEASYVRVIFRPMNSGIPAEGISLGEQRTLCLACCRWMVSEADANFGRVTNHTCNSAAAIQVISWDRELHDGVLEECVFCDQHWMKGQDVATPPAPSVYATATVLVEELERGIERNGVVPFESKLISFSDSRQQAAQLAYRFQKTNREFTFRQLIWQVIRDCPAEGMSSSDLIDEVYREARDDERLRRLIIDDDRHLNSRPVLENSISTLLFRESVTAYLTLEAQGIIRIAYDSALFRDVGRVLQADRLLFSKLPEAEQLSFLSFLLDWNMRFRYAIAPVPNGGTDINWAWLEGRNILPKSCVRSRAESMRGELSFVVSMATSRNRAFNFCNRLYKRVNTDRFRPNFALSDLQQVLFSIWDNVLMDCTSNQRTQPVALFNIGRSDPDGAVLKANFDSLRWSPVGDDEIIFRCDACGRISHYSIAAVCPLRDCTGTLQPVTGLQVDKEQFSPVRHYRQLVRHRTLRPLRVEEHTAQVAAGKRQVIEQDFRRTGPDSVDVICGSTTFELGVDLGTIHAVFMSNLPPRIANYRQRAGRAGRRCGMVPFILSYVRQRPHDQYFWTKLRDFIAGPVPVPHLTIGSQEVIARHANALFTRELLRDYSQSCKEKMPLDGPPAATFVGQVLTTGRIRAVGQSLTNVTGELRREFEAAFGALPAADRPVSAAARLGERLTTLRDTYLPLRAEDGAIAVLSDYGILPSYAFPLYVDELRLNSEPADRPPRSELKLQRDRRIALQEYMPGKVFVAGKTMIISDGVWQGYEERTFRVCSNRECQLMDFADNAPYSCPSCNQVRTTLTALIPRGGFFGSRAESLSEQDTELSRQRGETYFDPANEPPPSYEQFGAALFIAVIGSRVMEQAASRPRMRQFNPRPHSELTLEMAECLVRDLALPNMPAAHTLRRASGPSARRYHLMHEFTTDIVRIQIRGNDVGQQLASAPDFQTTLAANPDATRRRYYWDCFRRSLGEALVVAAGQVLDIEASELGVTFHPSADVVGGRELVVYDTAPGGAGYARRVVDNVRDVFCRAEHILASCSCGDSCYGCLRTYNNQMFHRRLNRHYVREGLAVFNRKNWAIGAAQ